MREEGVSGMNFLDAKDSRFQDFRKTVNARMKELASRGVCQTSRSLNSRTSSRESDGKTYFDFETLGAHQRILMGGFTRGTFLQNRLNRSATSLNRKATKIVRYIY